MLTGMFTFANSNSITESTASTFGTCTYTIITTYTFSDGSSYTQSITYTTTASSVFDCYLIASAHAKRLNAKQ